MSFRLRFGPFARGLRLLSAASLALMLSASGCGDDLEAHVSCSGPADCPQADGFLDVECCSGFCVVATVGCDSGYRYVNSEPVVVECVAAAQCMVRDMAVPQDLTSHD
jgi:hypothetical protein